LSHCSIKHDGDDDDDDDVQIEESIQYAVQIFLQFTKADYFCFIKSSRTHTRLTCYRDIIFTEAVTVMFEHF